MLLVVWTAYHVSLYVQVSRMDLYPEMIRSLLAVIQAITFT